MPIMRLNIKNQEAELIKATEALITAKADFEAQLRSARRLKDIFVASNKKLKLEIADLKLKNTELRKYKSLFKRRRKNG